MSRLTTKATSSREQGEKASRTNEKEALRQ
jgi:hypothetical protein